LAQLVRYVGAATGNARPIIALSPRLSALQARVMEWLPGPLLTRDNLLSMQRDSVCDCAFPEIFGVVPATLEAIATEYLAPRTRHSRFDTFRAHGGR
jgi:NADH dehydrogenase